MNKHYKVIWSKVKNGYVVVSELTKNNGKASQSKMGRNIGVVLSVLALCTGMTSIVGAADTVQFFSVNPSGSTVTSNQNNEGATGTHAMAIGIDASATGTEGVAIGKGAVAAGATSISMGKKSNASGSSSIAIGQSAASSASNTIAIGNSTEATYNYTVALGHSAKATALQGVAIGPYAKAEKDSSVAIGYFAKATDGASNGVSIGRSASVTKSGGVALGYISVADRSSGVTGYNPMSQTAPGASNAAIAQSWGFADEYNTLNTQLSDTSLTTEQKNAIRSQINKLISPYKSGYGAVSVGTGESTRQIINVAAGTEDSDAVNLAQLKALANKVDSDKIQYFSVKSTITANQDNSGATGTDSIAIGPNAKARHTGGIAIGKDASAAAGSMAALAIGYETSATGVASTALGVRAKATGSSVTAVGFDSVIKTASSGSGRTGDYSVAMGVSSLVDGGKSAIAIGNNAYAIDTTQATVVGTGAMVSALPQNTGDSIVITDGSQGTKTITKDDDGDYSVESTKDSAATLKARNGEAYGATALGSRATAHNLGAVAVGLYSTAIGDTSVAVGNNSMTLKDSAVAVGSGTIASAEDALSLGSYANASKDTSVALGAYAKADRGAGELFGYVPGLSGDALTTFQTDNANSIVWNSNRGAVSVGIKGKETRQITNVAAGSEDTDAVNVAQLKAVNSKVDANKISFFSVNPDGFVVNSNEDNKGATGSHAMAIGIDASATGQFSAAIGEGALASASDAIAIGSGSQSTGNMATAVGERAKATASSAVALGSAANATQNYAIAIGGSAKSENYRTIAMGPYAKALEENSIAIGYFATASEGAYDGVALGRSANVTAENGLALGRNASATMLNGIALGSYSVTDRDGNYLGYDPSVGGDFVFTSEMQAALDAANEAIYNRNQNPTEENDQIALEAIKKYKLLVAPWVSGVSAVSIGDKENGLTRQITNVAAGSTDTDAVNVAQLKALDAKVTKSAADSALTAGKNIRIDSKTDENTGVKTNTINLEDKITLGDTTDAAKQVTIDGNDATVTAGTADNQVKVDGSKGQVVIGDVANGIVIGNQGDGTTENKTGDYITGLDNTKWDAKNVVEDRAATEGQLRDAVNNISTEIGDINTDIEAIQNAKREFISDTGTKIEVGNAETLSIKGGADSTSLTESNIGVVNDGTKGFSVKLSSKLTGLDSVSTKTLTASDSITVGSGDTTTVISSDTVTTSNLVAGNTTVANSGVTIKATDSAKSDITLTNDTISMGGNQIHDVAVGTADTDAVNVSQLNSAVTNIGSNMNYLGNQINKLDNRVNRVGAGAAALAALHPLDYNPTTRWEFAAGVGNYKGANAVAVGAFYRPHSDLMFSIGSSYGGGENMVNAGVTWRVGAGQTVNYSSNQAMAQEITSLRGVVDSQQSMLKSQNEKLEAQSVQLEEQKQQIQQLLEAVAELRK